MRKCVLRVTCYVLFSFLRSSGLVAFPSSCLPVILSPATEVSNG